MITPQSKRTLEELGKSDYADALKKHLIENIKFLKGDIDSVESWVDVEARRKAIRILKELFYFLEPPEQKTVKRNNYV